MTSDISHPAPSGAEAGAALERRNFIVIAVLLVSAFIVMLNETVMGVALPPLMEALDVTAGAVQWLTTAFLLTMAIVIPITGFLIQRVNSRPLYITAISLFSLGTLICGLAPGLEVLIVGRVVQASGTAIMMPLLMTTVMTLVPPARRGRTMGNISIVMSVAPAVGPTVSGLILNYLDWRWLFWLILPISLGALVLGWRLMRNVTTPRYAPLDIFSVVLSALGFGGLVYGLSTIGESSHGEPLLPIWLPIALGGVGLAIFVWRQIFLQRRDGALLDFRTFTFPAYSIALGMMVINMMALFGMIILLPIFTQSVMGLDTLQTGLLLLPGGLLMGLLAPFVGRWYDRYGPTRLVVPGAVLVSAVLWSMTVIDRTTPVTYVLAGHLALSLGLALLFTPLFTASLGALPQRLYSHGSAMLGTLQQVAGAAGIALFVSLMTLRSEALMAEGADPIDALTGGLHLAFITGATLSLISLAASFFIRRSDGPDEMAGKAPVPAH
ncbi:DHA2 family efflux MFS transporter permease subunit [Pelagibacterium sediminicola]|uniref:DHA2 family efflux MFS transporter permease subunit n=1 Tax=Pelagibacterium sediminicola TaxID=2248761 RepID=UPI000E31550A|nr:DHA2 family efflux MFS transporter permease subunit [Pelagibacterium sediminicola]